MENAIRPRNNKIKPYEYRKENVLTFEALYQYEDDVRKGYLEFFYDNKYYNDEMIAEIAENASTEELIPYFIEYDDDDDSVAPEKKLLNPNGEIIIDKDKWEWRDLYNDTSYDWSLVGRTYKQYKIGFPPTGKTIRKADEAIQELFVEKSIQINGEKLFYIIKNRLDNEHPSVKYEVSSDNTKISIVEEAKTIVDNYPNYIYLSNDKYQASLFNFHNGESVYISPDNPFLYEFSEIDCKMLNVTSRAIEVKKIVKLDYTDNDIDAYYEIVYCIPLFKDIPIEQVNKPKTTLKRVKPKLVSVLEYQ
jgi:hypothetical protein